jgi:AcrR family transcriptional regulator
MAKKTKVEPEDHSTEEKIKQAARKVFTQKGFAAARTRDIAEEAGINLALLNYYFRSKEKLFDIVMRETLQQFIMAMKGVFNDEKSSLIEKSAAIVDRYIELFKVQPNIPLFVLSEMKADPVKFIANMGMKSVLFESHFFKQVVQATKGRMHPLHFIMNLIGLTVFPFVASPLLVNLGNLKQADFDKLMQERKKMIPLWIEAILKVK